MLDLRQSSLMHFELNLGFIIQVFHMPLMVISMSQSVPILGAMRAYKTVLEGYFFEYRIF